jgi:hypothetical protein
MKKTGWPRSSALEILSHFGQKKVKNEGREFNDE